MRIHQKMQIVRRTDVPQKNDYRDYLPDLAEDFHHICGYCGKTEQVTKNAFEIDHFVPIKTDAARKTDYSNLVYACFQCNRKKSNKWPTNDKAKHNDGIVGFVDPTTEEYDLHVGRASTGEIEHYTPIGKYMCKKAFLFHLRPMSKIWLAMQIIEKKEMLRERFEGLPTEAKSDYVAIDKELDSLYQFFFKKHE